MLKKNIIYNFLYQILNLILPIITIPYVSRILGANKLGEYSYTFAITQYFVLIGMLGISIYGNRQVAYLKEDKEKLSKEFWSIYLLQFIMNIISFSLYFIIFVIVNNRTNSLYIIQSIIILTSLFDISWFFIGYQHMKEVVIRNVLVKLVGVLFILAFVKNSNDLNLYAIIIAGSNLLGQIVMWLNLKGKIKLYFPNKAEIFKHLRPSSKLFISQLAIQIYILLDKTMLGLYSDSFQVGIYDGAQKTIKITLTIVTSLGVVIMPKISELYSKNNIHDIKILIYKVFRMVNLIAFPIMFGLISISDIFSIWFYGEGFSGVNTLLKLGAIIIVFISWSNILGMQIMIPMGKEKHFTRSVLFGAITNLILNLFLIRAFKAYGAMVSSIAAEGVVTCIQLYFLRDFIDIKKLINIAKKPLVGSLSMYFLLELFKIINLQNFSGIVILIIIGASVYSISLYLLKEKTIIYLIDYIKNKNRIVG
ncbi:flippase [Clostridium thermobutyricum]|uniref:flippase n=1 Tax=Clostridium thermobutyricum TaxID=29372 RepID=UPI001A9B5B79|nr:flippase [Clostridium thermobutyricum]